jgi:hypothetical protein
MKAAQESNAEKCKQRSNHGLFPRFTADYQRRSGGASLAISSIIHEPYEDFKKTLDSQQATLL